ncbi:NUDIX domain-containing protein, partial [Candidatus Woesearchaeota archaeon]|nr:NUDIX domain-containing protein [Candidatus Woesearchaeota archaeon]
EHALRREIKEETNLELEEIQFLTVLENIFDPVFVKKKHFIHINFTAKAKNPSSVLLNEEATAYKWAAIEETEKMDIEPYTKKLISFYKKKQKE